MTATSNNVLLDPEYEPLFRVTHQGIEPETRYFLFTGGRAGSKSFSTSTWVGDTLCRMDNWRVLFTRYTMVSAELSIIPEFTEKLERLGVHGQFKVTKTRVQNTITESDVIFSGVKTSSGNQTAKLKSIAGVNVLIIEEGEEFESEDDFDKIDESIRRNDAPNIVVILMNPPTSDHWIYKRWIEHHHKTIEIDNCQIPISTHPEVTHVHTTFLNSWQHLSKSYLKKIKFLRKTDREKYEYRFLGKWRTQAEGVVFDNWREGEFDESLSYCYGQDYGYFPDPLAFARVAVDHKRMLIYCKEVLYETETDNIEARYEAKKISKRDLIVTDTNEKRTTQNLRKLGYNIQNAAKGKGSIAQDIRDMKNYTIIVDPGSTNLKKELNNYVWNDKKASIPIDDFNHLLDAIRYAFRRLVRKSSGVKRRN